MFRLTTIFAAAVLISQFSAALSGQDAKPTVRDILNRYVQAVGGYEALSSVKTMKSVSKVAQQQKVGNEEENSFEYTSTKLRSQERWVQRNSMGSDSSFDGSKYWVKNKSGKPFLIKANRYPFDFRDPISYPLHLADFPGTTELVGKTEIGGKPAFRLKVEPAVPEPNNMVRMTPRELLFEVKTGLLLKIVHDSKTVEFEDYRKVNGVLVPFQYNVTTNAGDITDQAKITTDSIEFDIKLDERLLLLGGAVDN